MTEFSESVPQEILSHYGQRYDEEERLHRNASGILEFARSQEIISRYLPPSTKVVLDVGGGPGAYSCWLARKGYQVHLIDPVPKHIDQAKRASQNQPDHPITSVSRGDARSLPQDDGTCDAVLLMGPMYHLTLRKDRICALREASRVLRSGGLVLVSAINRFASLLSGLQHGFIDDPHFVEIMEQDLATGQHRDSKNLPQYFTTSFFHRPEELEVEILEAGLTVEDVVALQGPGWLATDFAARWSDLERREQLLKLIRAVEHEPSLLSMGSHFMAVARK